jgi:hypothetical protein
MSPSEQLDRLIADLGDWRGDLLARARRAILAADPAIIEEWKYRGSPVWSANGQLVVGNAHKDKVKLTFSHGAKLDDPDGLFNAGLEGNFWRAIDLFQDSPFDESALTELVASAVAYNRARQASKPRRGKTAPPSP